jgi:N-acetyl-anhydromuramyl-L-alanine amidase AmpD
MSKAANNEAFVREYQARRRLPADGWAGSATLADLDKLAPAIAPAKATPPASGIKYLTIHCAATPRGRDVKAATIVNIGKERFGQASYHHVVELDGSAVRTLRDDQRGAHVGGHNTGNIGICYVGGVEADMKPADTRTDAQKAALRKLVAEYRAKYPGIIVRGHRDWPGVAKACPSFSVADAL